MDQCPAEAEQNSEGKEPSKLKIPKLPGLPDHGKAESVRSVKSGIETELEDTALHCKVCRIVLQTPEAYALHCSDPAHTVRCYVEEYGMYKCRYACFQPIG